MYPKILFDLIIYVSVVALLGVFAFQVWAFIKDKKNKEL